MNEDIDMLDIFAACCTTHIVSHSSSFPLEILRPTETKKEEPLLSILGALAHPSKISFVHHSIKH